MYNSLVGRPDLCALAEQLPAAALLLAHAGERAEELVMATRFVRHGASSQHGVLAAWLSTYARSVRREDRTWRPGQLGAGLFAWAERIPVESGRIRGVPEHSGGRLVDLAADLGDRMLPDDLLRLTHTGEWETFHLLLLGDANIALAYLMDPSALPTAEEAFFARYGQDGGTPRARRAHFLERVTFAARNSPDRVLARGDLVTMAITAAEVLLAHHRTH